MGAKQTGIAESTWDACKSTYSNNSAVCSNRISLAGKLPDNYQAVGAYVTLPPQSTLIESSGTSPWLYERKFYNSTLEVYIDGVLCGSTAVAHGTDVTGYDIRFNTPVTVNSSSVITLSFNRNTFFFSGFGTGYRIGAWYCQAAYNSFILKLED